MLSIYNAQTTSMANDHEKLIFNWVKARVESKRIKKEIKNKLLIDIKLILKGKPNAILKLSKKYNKLFPRKTKTVKKKKKLVTDSRVSYIFNYKEFRRKFGFELAQKLEITCCPYCNRNYTTAHTTLRKNGIDKKDVFPEFDHFYHKNKHPFLALSFFNLIPSCNVCNSYYKGTKDPVVEKLFHPYTPLKPDSFNFKFYAENYKSLIGKGLKIKIDFNFNADPRTNESLKNSLRFFDIKSIYENCHSNLIKDIIDKRIAYNNKYMTELQTVFKLSFENSYKLLFESHYEETELIRRPFSKIKKDIYRDQEIAKHIT